MQRSGGGSMCCLKIGNKFKQSHADAQPCESRAEPTGAVICPMSVSHQHSASLTEDTGLLALLGETMSPQQPGISESLDANGLTDPLDELFGNGFLQQSVFPTLMSSANEQQQQTATFCPQQFPDSWSAYLSRGTSLQVEQDLPEHAQETSTDLASPLSLEAKQERMREKNRKAMRKFRAKQREKSKESENKMQDLESQLQKLQLDNELLQFQNRMLKLANVAHKRVSHDEDGEDEAPEEWEPRRGWTDFNPHATMVLHLGLTDNASPHRFTAEQMRTMTQGQFVALLRAYVLRAAPLVLAANDDLSSAPAHELKAIHAEMNALAANLAMNNPVRMNDKWGMKPDAAMRAPEAPLEGPLPADVKQACLHLLSVLKVTAEQRAAMVKVHELVRADVRRLKVERSKILMALVEQHNDEEYTVEPKRFPEILESLKRLTSNAEDLHRCICIYGSTIWRDVLNPIQTAKIAIHSFPQHANIWMLTAAAAEADLASPAAQEVRGMFEQMESRYREVWRWHSSMTQAGRLHSPPISTINDYGHIAVASCQH